MKFDSREIAPPMLISSLRKYDLLPAIVFVPSRKRCDEAASSVALDRSHKGNIARQTDRREIFEKFEVENPEIGRHKHRRILLESGIASHHAGHIPSWKLLIEKMMARGLVNALFATSTVAAGVDFPARSVVISNAETRGDEGWRSLSASELQQMTGRAGRRGKDNVGFVILAPGRFQNPRQVARLLGSPPDALESKFRETYSSLLNLLDAFGSFAQIREFAEKSFAFWKSGNRKGDIWKPFENRARVLDRFEYLDFGEERVLENGVWLADLRIDKPLLAGEVIRKGIAESLDSAEFGGLMASMTADSDREYGEPRLSAKLDVALAKVEEVFYKVSEVEREFGVEPTGEINFSAAGVVLSWAQGTDWEDLIRETDAEEGDLVRLLARTGESLMQVANLRESNSFTARLARISADKILRSPVK